jgi:hypothetical protein
MAKVDQMDGKAQTWFHNKSRVGKARVHARRPANGKPINVLDRFVIWEGGIGEHDKQSTRSKILTLRTRI